MVSGSAWGNVEGRGGKMDIEWWGLRRRGNRLYELATIRKSLCHQSQLAMRLSRHPLMHFVKAPDLNPPERHALRRDDLAPTVP